MQKKKKRILLITVISSLLLIVTISLYLYYTKDSPQQVIIIEPKAEARVSQVSICRAVGYESALPSQSREECLRITSYDTAYLEEDALCCAKTKSEVAKQCEAGGGRWISPTQNDPREPLPTWKPYCGCDRGYTWDGNTCNKIPDATLCQNSNGAWQDNHCICPSHSTGWTEGFGCDYMSPIPN